MSADVLPERVSAIRAFNRFYTGVMGFLDQGLLQSKFSLTEARVVFELAQSDSTEVADLRTRMGIDAAHLSRILGRFQSAGVAVRQRSAADGRRQLVRLTAVGRAAFDTLNARSDQQSAALLSRLSVQDQDRLLGAMGTIEELLGEAPAPRAFVVRGLRPGDLGWVVERHGALYAQEYGWDQRFEALVAGIVADYATQHDAERENAWIAESAGRPVGCVFCVRKDDRTAQLRLLLVDPGMRGTGLGTALVDECVAFARGAGYAELVLWTNDVLDAARRIYQRAGFELVDEEKHRSFGHDLVGQYWSRRLAPVS